MRNAPAWIVLLAVINFLAYVLISLHLGGDAVNGKIDSGHYYLGSHGHYTEVSQRVFTYSRWHTYAVWFTHGLAFITASALTLRRKDGSNA